MSDAASKLLALRPLHRLPVQPPLTALVLDDVAFDRRRLIRACEKAGIAAEFREAGSLAEFRACLEAVQFDLVFVDYRLPDGDGLAAMTLLAADGRHADVATIMIAGDLDAAVAVEAMKAGCSDYINKADIGPAALQRAVSSAVGNATLRREIATMLSLHDALRQAMARLAETAGGALRADLENLIAAAGPGAAPSSARRLRDFLDEVGAYVRLGGS
jgi:PleD family two-component response regulator